MENLTNGDDALFILLGAIMVFGDARAISLSRIRYGAQEKSGERAGRL